MRRLFPLSAETPAGSPAGSPLDTSVDTSVEAPAGSRTGPSVREDREWGLDELAEAYAYPDLPAGPGRPPAAWLRANMVSSLDGAAHHDGRSKQLSSAADMRIFGVLRGLADAVVVGAETVRKEGYRPARAREAFAARRAARGRPPVPAIAVVSASLDLDFSLPLFTEPLVPTLVVTGAQAPADRLAAARRAGAEVVLAGEGARVDPARVVAALAERGLTRLLSEGGPKLLGQFAAAGVLDELCLSLAPLVAAGDAARIVNGPALVDPERFDLFSVLEDAGFLFTSYRRKR